MFQVSYGCDSHQCYEHLEEMARLVANIFNNPANVQGVLNSYVHCVISCDFRYLEDTENFDIICEALRVSKDFQRLVDAHTNEPLLYSPLLDLVLVKNPGVHVHMYIYIPYDSEELQEDDADKFEIFLRGKESI